MHGQKRAHEKANVGLFAKQTAKGITNVGGLNKGGGNLVQQWRKKVVIVVIYQDNVYVRVSIHGANPLNAGETSADHHPFLFFNGHRTR